MPQASIRAARDRVERTEQMARTDRMVRRTSETRVGHRLVCRTPRRHRHSPARLPDDTTSASPSIPDAIPALDKPFTTGPFTGSGDWRALASVDSRYPALTVVVATPLADVADSLRGLDRDRDDRRGDHPCVGDGRCMADPAARPPTARDDGRGSRRDQRRRHVVARHADGRHRRGRPTRQGTQLDARRSAGVVRRAEGIGGEAPPVPRRCVARTAHAADVDPRVRRAVPASASRTSMSIPR